VPIKSDIHSLIMKRCCSWLLLMVPLCAWSQEYKITQYGVGHGLSSNVIKAVTQDSSGFFWIATDEGILRFDGITFTPYKEALHSQYAKGFLTSHTGQLYAFGDLDLITIDNRIDTVIFQSVRRGTRNPTDSTLWFPKSLFEDKSGTLWLGEPQSVANLRKGILRRFEFDIKDRSPQFLRSFSFFEDAQGFLYTVSYAGNVYMFDDDESAFFREPVEFPEGVNDVKTFGGFLWIATESGLYKSVLLEDGGYSYPEKALHTLNVSAILPLTATTAVLTTFESTHYIADLANATFSKLPFELNAVNSAYQSTEGDLWLASNDGLILLRKNLFLASPAPASGKFVEAITQGNGSIYHATMNDLYRIGADREGKPSTRVLTVPNGYFQSLQSTGNWLWASNAFTVLLIQNEKVVRKWDFEKSGRFIHDTFLDESGNLWLSQAGTTNVTQITSSMSIRRFHVDLHQEGIINTVRSGPNGMYVTSNGEGSYLFHKPEHDSVFRNVSLPVNFVRQGDFNVTDLAWTDDDLWLATSEGLLRYDGDTIVRMNLGEVYTTLPVKAVKRLGDQLVFNNAVGLFRFNPVSGDYWLYDESNGLPSNTITTRGLFVDNLQRIWVGTSVGLAHSSRTLLIDEPTTSPRFLGVRVNGTPVRFSKTLNVPFGAFLDVTVNSITFPTSNVQIQYRLPELDSSWRLAEGNHLTLSNLSAGLYTIETRAKKNGGYSWSKVNKLAFVVGEPFWQESWFTGSAMFAVIVIAWISYAFASFFNRRRRQQLENLVNLRTSELKTINDELSMRNSELDRFVYSASHDLSAPLKSIRGLVTVARMDKPDAGQASYLDMIERSVIKLEVFIRDVINYSRNTRMPVENTLINFEEFVQVLIDDHQHSANFDKIKFEINDELQSPLVSDEMRLKIVFNNLLSNAIKFHMVNDDRQPFVRIKAEETNEAFIFSFLDNGRGIPDALKDKIFEMFFRATDSVQGSGLGLYILRETVYRMNGKVEVVTKLEFGTNFVITLPKDQ
jgi:signal transduction histidine kinase/ligand-binding sensor domain-containing protein